MTLVNTSLVVDAVNDCIDDGLQSGDSLMLKVTGDCMAPVIKDNDSVKIIRQESYLPGDVVAYYSSHEQRRLIHRVLGKVPFYRLIKSKKKEKGVLRHYYLIKADNSTKPDVIVGSSAIHGKAVDIKVGLIRRVSSVMAAYYLFVVIMFKKISGVKVSG